MRRIALTVAFTDETGATRKQARSRAPIRPHRPMNSVSFTSLRRNLESPSASNLKRFVPTPLKQHGNATANTIETATISA